MEPLHTLHTFSGVGGVCSHDASLSLRPRTPSNGRPALPALPPKLAVLAVNRRQVDATSFTTSEGPPCAYLGCPHPQAFLDASVGATVAPVWHLGPCVLVTEAVELAPFMFALGPEYTGVWTAESPLEAISSANAAGVLRRLQVRTFICSTVRS